jgi:hypothetical protein
MLREEHRLRVFENEVLRRIFQPKRNEVTGEWRELHNEELHNLYSQKFIRIIKPTGMRSAGYVSHMGEMRNACRILAVKSERKRLLGRPRHRWVDIELDVREKGSEGVDWIYMAQDRGRWQAFVNTAMNLQVP